ncbi:MAG: L-cystine transporter [Fusobacteriaceae bacterium]
MLIFINVLIMITLIGILYSMQKKFVSFSKRVFTSLGMAIVFGVALQLVYGSESSIVKDSMVYINVVGAGYVRLLKMIVMPLIMVSITSSIINLKDGKSLGKMGGMIIGILVGTSVIAALIGYFTSAGFGLTAEGLELGAKEAARAAYLEGRAGEATAASFVSKFVEMIPDNPFLDMTGARSSSTIAVVIFSGFTGISALGIAKKKAKSFELFKDMVNAIHDVVMRIVTLVLRLTPFGVLALMTRVIATSNVSEILKLGKFVIASYVAIILMFLVHLILITLTGLNPIRYVQKSLPVLTFAFTSRTSAGAIPLNVEAQVKDMGVSEGVANLSASFGSSIGQNGCAAIYPAMLAFMIAPTVGINPLNPAFIIQLVVIIAISSFGVAGVGGGATFAALIVLASMDLPVGLVGLLIAIEPLIDMGRTALNVSGSMTAGVITSKILGDMDTTVYSTEKIAPLDQD